MREKEIERDKATEGKRVRDEEREGEQISTEWDLWIEMEPLKGVEVCIV